MPCPTCLDLLPAQLNDPAIRPGQRVAHFIFLSELKNSVENTSCPSCQLLFSALSLYKEWDEEDYRFSLELRLAIGQPLQLFWRRDAVYIEIYTREAGNNAVPATIGQTIEVSPDSTSDACIELASSWIKKCRAFHQACQTTSFPSLPTRVIDVNRGGEPFLVESQGRSGDYIALSYCWGDDKTQVLKALPANYEAHRKEIARATMPRTIRDAIDICRRLGFQYIWIDALCIVQGREPFQGDVSDFDREGPKMADVYANATLSLGADGAEGNKDGIYREQAYGKVPYQFNYGTSGTPVFVRTQLARQHNVNALLMRMPMSPISLTEPINMRAWTLAESIFSNRMLHYTSEELVWECNEERWCECGQQVKIESNGINSSNRVMRSAKFGGDLTREGFYRHWHNIVQLFSERQLGKNNEGDKLVALSRVASRFCAMLPLSESGEEDKYLAGLWKGDILKSLLWVVEDDFYRGMRDTKMQWRRPWTTEPRAPSWSWAAVEAPVLYHPIGKFLQKATVLDASVKRLDEVKGKFGKVLSGKLVIRAHVIHELALVVEQATVGDVYAGYTDGLLYSICNTQGELYAFICDYPLSVADSSSRYTCLYIGRTDYSGEEVPYYYTFLVLLRTGSGSYTRIGISSRSARNVQAKLSNFLERGKEEEITIE